MNRLGLGLLLGLAVCAAKPARAQPSAMQSVGQSGAGVADGAEPWGVVLNPASIAMARGFLLGLRDTELQSDSALPRLGAAGRGTGFYVVHPLPYLSRLVAGGGLEILRPGISSLPAIDGKLTLDLAYRIFDSLSLGLSYAHLFSSDTATSYDGLDTLNLGVRVTGGRFFAAGLMLHDLPAPHPRDATLPAIERSYELEVLLRPIGDQRVELGAGLRVYEQTQVLQPRFRLWARPVAGLGIGIDSTLALGGPTAANLEYRIGVGLSLDFANIGASGFALFGSSSGQAAGLHGGSVAVRASFERYPALYRGPGRVYKIELHGKRGESMLRLLAALRELERDSRARGVVMLVSGFGGGWGVADELRQAILRLRAAGRHVVAYGADLSDREYYIATAAERIYLDPIGSVRLAGISNSGFFVKEALDKLGVRADLLRVGDFKSAPEMWMRSEPSDAARQQRQSLIDDLFARLVDAVSSGRQLPLAHVKELVERGLFPAQLAVRMKLVDAVATGEEVEEHLAQLIGEPLQLSLLESLPAHPASYAPPGVAVISVDGDITEGRSRRVPLLDLRIAGGQSLLEALYEAGRDPQVRAVVLRVDSPGGSALISDLLARQVAVLSRVKPVVCSFGDVAASGGYYLAAPCSVIFTDPSTTTGSIGIFGGKVDLSGLLSMLGVRRVTLQQGSHADLETPFRPYSDVERTLVGERLQQGYDRFLEIVMRGRHFTRLEAEARAQGRVWSGSQAIEQKLCDRSGGFMDAVAEARKRAGLSADGEGHSPLFFYPKSESSLLSRILGLPDLVENAAAPSDFEKLLQATSGLLAGFKTALLLLDSDLLMRLDGEAPR